MSDPSRPELHDEKYRRKDRIAVWPNGYRESIRGIPNEGATLDNDLGDPVLPEGAEWYCNEFGKPVTILISGARANVNGEIVDRRPWAKTPVDTGDSGNRP